MTASGALTGSVTVSAVSQLGAKVVHLTLNVVSTLAILHYLAPSAYGSYVFVLTITTLAGVVADFGLPKLGVREVLRPGADQNAVVGTLIVIRLGLALAAVVLCQLALLAFRQPPEVHLAALVASATIVGEAVVGIVLILFEAHLRQQYEALVRVAAEALETGLVLLLVATHASLPALFVPPVVGVLLALLLSAVLARRTFALRPRFTADRVRPLLIEALPLGPALLIGVLYLKLDTLVVGALRPSADIAYYGAAYQPVEYLFLASGVLINVIFPLAAKAWSADAPERFATVYRRGTDLIVVGMVIVPLVAAVAAPGLVAVAFGPAYEASVAPFRLLTVALVLMSVNAWQSVILLAGGQQRRTLRYNLAALLVMLVLSVTLVHAMGIVGAATAALITSVLVLCLSTRAISQHMFARPDYRRIGALLGTAAAVLVVLLALQAIGLAWPVLAVIGVCGYLGSLHLFGLLAPLREVLT